METISDQETYTDLKLQTQAIPETAKAKLGPGELLRIAREKQGLAQAEIAQQLHLADEIIRYIDADDYQNINRSHTFIKGYLRSYANLVGLTTTEVLDAFNGLGLVEERSNRVTYALENNHRVRKHHSLLRWGSVVIGVVLLILLILWWQDHSSSHNQATQHTSNSASVTQVNTSTAATTQSTIPTATISLSQQHVTNTTASTSATIAAHKAQHKSDMVVLPNLHHN